MYFRAETSRTQAKEAVQVAADVFGGRLSGHTDALFRDSARDRVIAYTGLKFYAPVLMHIINDPEVYDVIRKYDGDILISDDGLTMSTKDGDLEIGPKATERIKAIRDTVFR